MVVLFAIAAAAKAFKLTNDDNKVVVPIAAQLAWPKNFLRLIGFSLNLIYILM